jgi:hypothetical protein
MARAPDDDAELLRQVRKLVGVTDEQPFKWEVDRYIKAAALPLEGPLRNPKKLDRIIKDCRRALQSIETIGGRKADMIRVELANVIRLCEQMVREIPAAKWSGGDQATPILKRITVERAVELILTWGERLPTVELVSEVAAKLFELATGEVPSNMDDYASELFKKMERNGFPDARARRRLDSGGVRAARDQLEEKLWGPRPTAVLSIPEGEETLDLFDAVPDEGRKERKRRAASPGKQRKTRGGGRRPGARR